jgi:gliding motility-associated-like protein
MALLLNVTGADPGGALTYEFDCDGTQYIGGTPICLSGTGSHTLTACKVGGNPNAYSVTSVPKPNVPDSIFVRNGCTQTLVATGFSTSTIQWTAVNSGTNTALFNSYLHCSPGGGPAAGCATVVVTPTGSVPVQFVDYRVSGFGQAPCGTNFYADTVRVWFYNDLAAPLSPTTICFGSISGVLNPTVTGGKTPYTYTWSTGSNSSSITVGPGTYSVRVSDGTGCPPITTTVTVGQFTLPITANAGTDRTVCKSSPTAALSGTVVTASGGIWSGGTGTFAPSTTSLTTSYLPAPAEVNTGSVQLYLTTTGNQGCPSSKDTVNIFFQNVPVPAAGTDFTVCANNNVVTLSGTVTGFPATGIWSTTGSGTFATNTSFATTYTPGATDISTGSVNIILTSANTGSCPATKDTLKINITPKPVVNAGADFTICSNGAASLTGTITGATTTGSWSTMGDGGFSAASTATTTYTPGTNDITAGTVTLILTSTGNGGCIPVTDTLRLGIKKLATIVFSPIPPVCSSTPSIALSATVTGGTSTGSWSPMSGSFNNVNSLSPVYALSVSDKTLSVLIFTLTSTGNSPCAAVTNTVSASIIPEATVIAGSNQSVCSSQNPVTLNTATIITNFGSPSWSSGGTGTFTSASFINTTYSLSATDISNGIVTLSLAVINNSICPNKTSTLTIAITPEPVVATIASTAVCTNTCCVSLTGTITGATNTGSWTTSGSGSFNNATALPTSYSFSPGDKTAGTVIFSLTSTNNAFCPPATSTLAVIVIPEATLSAGSSLSVCSSQNPISLNTGTFISSFGSVGWTSSGTGTFTPTNSISTSYAMSAADINLGTVTLSVTASNNSVCPNKTSTLSLTITKQPTVATISSSVICSNTCCVALTGTVTGGTTTGIWSASGSGIFNNATALPTTYSLSASDKTTGTVVFTLTSTNNGACASPGISTITVSIIPEATLVAGNSLSVCSSPNPVLLNTGTYTSNFGSVAWTSSGTGTFTPTNSVSSSYLMSVTDINNGFVSLALTASGNSVCPNKTSTLSISISKEPVVAVMPSASVCINACCVVMSGTVSGGSTTGIWAHTGTGSMNLNALSSTYSFSPADKSAGLVTYTLTSANNNFCPAATATTAIFIIPTPTVVAGNNQQRCSSDQSVALNGTSSTNSGTWTASGAGAFLPSNNLSTSYAFTGNDILAGFVNFTLTSTAQSICPADSKTLSVFITRQPTVNVGPDLSICANAGSSLVAISGSVFGGGSSGNWSGGSSNFSPGSTLLNTGYIISAGDISTGSVSLILTSTNNGPCGYDEDTLVVTIRTPATASAGSYRAYCSSEKLIPLNGSITGGNLSGAEWFTSGTGIFTPTNSAAVTSYSMSPSDINNGQVTLTLTSTNNGACPQGKDIVSISLKQKALVNAGADKSICSNLAGFNLTGTVTGVTTTGIWTTSGTGIFSPNNTGLNSSYIPSSGDISGGQVRLILTSTNNDVCPATPDTLNLSIVQSPVLLLKIDSTICEKQSPFKISAIVTGSSSALEWMTTGTGTFTPNNFSTTTRYMVSKADISMGSVVLTLNSFNNGPCATVKSSIAVKLFPSPKADFSASTYTVFLPADPVIFTNTSVGADAYSWSFGDGKTSVVTGPSHDYADVGDYVVQLIALNDYGCADSAVRQIRVIREVQFPNAFTPNPNGSNGGAYNPKDYSNDVFFPYTGGVVEYDLMIFNRWGELLFRSKDINVGWDGYFNGNPCQQDAYVWKAYMKFFDDRIYNKTGSVTLLR